jgi:hypothetical protein
MAKSTKATKKRENTGPPDILTAPVRVGGRRLGTESVSGEVETRGRQYRLEKAFRLPPDRFANGLEALIHDDVWSDLNDSLSPLVERFWMDSISSQVLEEALERCFALSFEVAREDAVTAAAIIAQNLCPQTMMAYDEAAGRLVVWRYELNHFRMAEPVTPKPKGYALG